MTPIPAAALFLALATASALIAVRLIALAIRVEALWLVPAAYYAACAVAITSLACVTAGRDT